MLTRADKEKDKARALQREAIRLQKALEKRGLSKNALAKVPPPPAVPELPPSEAALATEGRIRKVNRLKKYQTPEDMAPVIQDFFDYCVERQQPPLITTLALALGFASRGSIDDYLNMPEFSDLVRRAKLVCEDFAAKGLISGKNTVGFIFLLKQYGWRDVQENVTTVETHEQRIARLLNHNR